MSMSFEEVFLQSAKHYFKGKSFDETEKLGSRKYTKSYFDSMEKEMSTVKDKEEEEV